MKKIHKVNYSEIFSGSFSPEKIDSNLKQLEIEEKLYLLDNIIDYIYYNFKQLRAQKEESKETSPQKKKKSHGILKQQEVL